MNRYAVHTRNHENTDLVTWTLGIISTIRPDYSIFIGNITLIHLFI